MSSSDPTFSSENAAPAAPGTPAPLTWVIDGLCKSFEEMAAALARCNAPHPQPGREPLDIPALQQELHQAGRALQMLETGAPERLVQAMEAALPRLAPAPEAGMPDAGMPEAGTPEAGTPEAARTLEDACLALLDYFKALLAGRQVAAVALFPAYRAVQALAGNDKAHPADLWLAGHPLPEPAWEGGVPEGSPALAYGPQARALLDAGVLAFVKAGQATAALQLRAACLGFVAAQAEPEARSFWRIAAGFFDAFARELIQPDVYAKRTASRVLLQYAAMARGDSRRPERLIRELLYFCAQAGGPAGTGAAALHAVRAAHGLGCDSPVDHGPPAAPLGLAAEGAGDELRGVFLEEAREAVGQGGEALDALAADAAHASAQDRLRRAFHTLKGSARMAGLDEFAEAGAAMEQLLHAGPAGQQPMPAAWQALAREALQALAAWVDAIAGGEAQDWSATPFRAAADAMRIDGQRAPVALRPARRRLVPLDLQDASPVALPDPAAVEAIDFAAIESALRAGEPLSPAPAYDVPQPAAATLEGGDGRTDSLRITAYLNAADEWSRRLEALLQQWRLAPQQPQPEDAAGCAHALANSSAAVGCEDLSRLAGVLEQALMHARVQGAADAWQLAVFQAAASEIRRLLHQFAAGFLKPVQPPVEEALQRLLEQLASQPLEAPMARRRIDACLERARSSLHDLGGSLERLRQQLRDIELLAETQLRPRDAAQGPEALEFDRHTRLQERTRRMAGSVGDVATAQRRLQSELAAAAQSFAADAAEAQGRGD